MAKLKRHARLELEDEAHGRLELEDADTANTTAVSNERTRLNEVRDRLTRLQIERGVITKADATALRKVAWPHILQQHCTCEDDGLCEYLRAKFNAGTLITQPLPTDLPPGNTQRIHADVSSSCDVIASAPHRLKMGRRIKANHYKKDIDKNERSIVVLQEHQEEHAVEQRILETHERARLRFACPQVALQVFSRARGE